MGRYNPPKKETRKRSCVQSNKITKYLSPKDEKNVSVVRNNFEDLSLSSPQKKRVKNSVSPAKTPPVLLRSNLNAIAKNRYTSPAENKPSLAVNFKTTKSSPRKSARVLFATTPIKRKKPAPEKSSPSKVCTSVDMNANVSTKHHRRKKIDLSGEKFIKKVASSNPASSVVFCEEPSPVFAKGTTKLVAFDSSIKIPSEKSDPREGSKFFKEVALHMNSCFNNPGQRLKVNFPTCLNQDDFSNVEPSCERQVYSESLMAVLDVDGFTDTGLDLIGNYLSNEQFLSWSLLRGIIYFAVKFCNDEDFSKTLRLCMHQLRFHPPGSDGMREYYLSLINQDDEITIGEQNEKGLLSYLMEAFTNFYKYCSPSKAKRPKKKNAKYFEDTSSDEDENTMEAGEETDPEKKRKGRKKTKVCEEAVAEDIYDKTNLGVNSLEDLKEINDTLRSALNDVGKKTHIVISSETLIERQFQLLDFVVKILEVDFVQWSKRNVYCTREKLVSANETPLIAALLFDRQIGFSVVSARMKEIFYLFAITEEKHRKYFQRLIALMAEVMRIFEGEVVEDDDSGKKFIRYPYISEKCENFSNELFSHCFQNSTFSSHSHFSEAVNDEQISRLQSLLPSWLRLLIANRLLNRTLGAKLSGNLASVIDVLKAFSYDDVTCSEELSQSSSVKVKDSHGQTQLSKLRSKKDINRKNPKGETPLHTACMRNKPSELQNYLLLPDVDIMVQDNNGWCPIHEAAVRNSVECCELLYEHASTFERKSALVSCRSFDGSTPLLEAVSKNCVEVADYLLCVGGSYLLKHVNSYQESVFDLCGSEEMKEVLNKYMDGPVKKFLRIPSQVWSILFTLISSYFETYGTELGLKYGNLNLSPADFNNVILSNDKKDRNVPLLLDSSLYIKDFQVINELRGWIEMLKVNNPDVKQLLPLDKIFS